jgi:acetolactate synthase-1/3 small subunit
VTADPRFERITIVASGDEQILEQIEKQLEKLEDVRDIKKLEHGSSVTRELILVKIRALDTQRQPIMNVTEVFHGKIVDVSHDSMVIELTGNQDKLDAFLDLLSGYEILELARTGLTGLTRGSADVRFLD